MVAGLQQLVNDGDELFGVDRFFQVEIGQWFSSLEGFRHIGGNHYYGYGGLRLGSLHDGTAIAVPETPVGYHSIVGVMFQLTDCVLRGGGCGRLVPGGLQNGTLQA